MLTNMAADYRSESSHERTSKHRAQAAVDELRRVLPRIIATETAELIPLLKFQQSQETHAENMTEDKVLALTIAQTATKLVDDRTERLMERERLLGSSC
jgi:hypothetical protein